MNSANRRGAGVGTRSGRLGPAAPARVHQSAQPMAASPPNYQVAPEGAGSSATFVPARPEYRLTQQPAGAGR